MGILSNANNPPGKSQRLSGRAQTTGVGYNLPDQACQPFFAADKYWRKAGA